MTMSDRPIVCPICGHENPPNAKLCMSCSLTINRDTRTVSPPADLEIEPKWGTRHLNKVLLLHIHGSNESLKVHLEEKMELVMGRYDTDTETYPELDFSNFGAVEKGVSRNHAVLLYQNESLRVADLTSANFTYLNNQKLIPNQKRIVRDGDEIRLGHLVMTVQFGDDQTVTNTT